MDAHQLSDNELLAAYLHDRHVACPSCGFDLIALRGQSCPECGVTFQLGLSRGLPSRRRVRLIVLAAGGLMAYLILCAVYHLLAVMEASSPRDLLYILLTTLFELALLLVIGVPLLASARRASVALKAARIERAVSYLLGSVLAYSLVY